MSKIKYRFDTRSLTYEKVEILWKHRILRVLSYLATGTVFAAITIWLAFKYLDSPKELIQKKEVERLRFQYEDLNRRLELMQSVLNDIAERDNNIYRVVFEAEPIPEDIRRAGIGGSDRYVKLQGASNSEVMIETTRKLDQVAKQLYIQSKSFDEVIDLAKNKSQMLASIPAIQPMANKDLKRMASGFGWRTHPIYKTQHFHTGMDFAANIGTPIYATGDGTVERADDTEQGYGNHVVLNHGFGYNTLYGHMSKYAVRAGQKVKRGDVIGYVGSTGMSTAPHLHYEVIKNGEKINPVNFYYNDLSPEEYKLMLELSQQASQSFD
jgi:murein DD-endopeptidase MepM/ murein hydrolase activator NlpD